MSEQENESTMKGASGIEFVLWNGVICVREVTPGKGRAERIKLRPATPQEAAMFRAETGRS